MIFVNPNGIIDKALVHKPMHEIRFHLYRRGKCGYDVIAHSLNSTELEEKLQKIDDQEFWNLDILPIRLNIDTLESYEEASY